MASKKDKILESAQRFVLKGQIDKAIKDYQQVVALDPTDIRHRQRLAELLVRHNRKDEAIQQYEDIGKHYADNSYFLKAIAIYKQIQRLSPGDLQVALTIASLNHQQGLVGNALAEYGQVAAQFEKDGAYKEALKVVEKMLDVDGEHTATRLRHAELLFTTGAQDASRQAFSDLASWLKARGRSSEAEAVAARMAQLFPGQQDAAEGGDAPDLDDSSLNVAGFGPLEEVPGVTPELPAPWESPPSAAPTAPAQEEPAGELPDLFSEPFELPEAAPVAAAAEPASLGNAWDAPGGEAPSEGAVAWEEEIELDLDDFSDHVPSAAEPAAAAPATVPENLPADAPAQGEMDLQLDFALELDFDEAPEPVDEAPQEPPHAVVELDLDSEEGVELTLPQESEAFPDFQWSEQEAAAEQLQPSETAAPEPAELPEALDLEPVELMEEGAGQAAEEPEVAVQCSAEPEPALPARGWDEIFPCMVQKGGAELDLDELESHYDLGIGYKEMGMYAGAIKEFDVAACNPQRRLDCLTLQAICYREKGEPDRAEELLRRGLELDVLTPDERVCLVYELAVLMEGRGEAEEAIGLYREVRRVNPAYQDVSRRLSALSGEEHLDIIDLELEEG